MNVPRLRFDGFDGEWKIHQLKEYFDFIDGDRGPNYPNEDDFNSEGHCVFLNAHNISENGLIFNRINWLSEEIHRKLRKGTVERGDLILTSRGSKLGKLALYDEKVPFEIMRINSAMLLIRKKRSDLDSNYSLYLFKESLLPKFINANKVGSAQPHITVKDIKRLDFSMPQDINEQKKIAHFFGLFNQRIEKQQEKIERLEHFKKGMMQKIFSQELRFKDEDGREFGEWEHLKLGEIVKVETGNKDTINKIEEGIYPFFVRSQTVERINSYSFDGEAILTAGDGVGVGKVFHYIDGKFDYHQRVYKLSDFKRSLGKYIFYYFKENFLKEAMKYNAKTSVDSVRRDMIVKMLLPLPNIPEQRKIAGYFSLIDKKIDKEKEKLMVLEEQKKGFMQGMFV